MEKPNQRMIDQAVSIRLRLLCVLCISRVNRGNLFIATALALRIESTTPAIMGATVLCLKSQIIKQKSSHKKHKEHKNSGKSFMLLVLLCGETTSEAKPDGLIASFLYTT